MRKQPFILHIVDSLAPGGTERMAIEIANATDPGRFQSGVCVTRSDLSLAGALKPNIDLLCLGRKRTFEWEKFSQFSAYCKARSVQILHVHGRSSLLLITFLAAYDRRLRNLGVVFHDHYGDVECRPSLPGLLRLPLWYLRPYYVGVHEKLTQAALLLGYDASRARTIRNAIDFSLYSVKRDAWHRTTSAQPGMPQGIVVANIRPSKGITTLLSALALVQDRPWKMAFVGSLSDWRYSQTCQQMAQQLGIDLRIRFLGERLDVQDLILQSDFGVLSSITESGPLALLEYAAAGLPFVSTRVGLIGRYLADRNLAEFVDPGDAQALSAALRRLIDLSPADRRERGERVRMIASEKFDIQQVMAEWYQVYAEVLPGSLV